MPAVTTNHRAPAATLQVERLVKSFAGTRVVDDVSFQLNGGQLLTLLGPSGSGKTTTMRMIAGFERPSGGDVRVGGVSIVDLPAHKRDIGVVFQQYALFPHLTVFNNVAYPLQMRRIAKPDIARRVSQALSMVRLDGFEGRYPRQLSGGQQQRVALARAIVFEPRLLLMDEPMGALDKRLREAMQVEIRQLQRQLGITTVLVTHDQVEALMMSDVIAVLDNGAIQQLGPPLEVYQRPANRFVADFLGESNLLTGQARPRPDGGFSFISRNGLTTQVGRDSAAPADESCWVVIRPEHICIGPEAAVQPNQCNAEVQAVYYVGDLVRYRVATEFGDELVVKTLAADQACRAGDRVSIGWRTEHCLFVAR